MDISKLAEKTLTITVHDLYEIIEHVIEEKAHISDNSTIYDAVTDYADYKAFKEGAIRQ